MTFVRNHARAIAACDFVVAVTTHFRILYIFVVMEVGSRKLLHINVTPHPTSEWTLQQLREAIPSDHQYRWMIHDRSGIFSGELDKADEVFGVTILKTPIFAPQGQRLLRAIDRQFAPGVPRLVHPPERATPQMILREWMAHYNQGRPHMTLGPDLPSPPPGLPVELRSRRHVIPAELLIKKRSVLGGLHHEYRLEEVAARQG